MTIPLVSVLLPVYNGSSYVREAIGSVLDQDYLSFELIIIDDGSTDDSASIISTFHDERIRFIQQKNQGLAATLNCGIALATGTYIARQDQDDVSLPERFSRQVSYLESNLEYGMVGTWAAIWEGATPTDRCHRHPPDNLKLKFDLLFNNPFVHSSMMIRRTVFDEVGGYATDPERQPPEDYELWSRVARRFKVANLPEVLHIYREMPHSMSRSGDNPFMTHVLQISAENLAWATGIAFPQQSHRDLSALMHAQCRQYSRKTSFGELLSLLRKSSLFLTVDAGVDCSALDHAVRVGNYNLCHHYLAARCSGRLSSGVKGALSSLLRAGSKLVWAMGGNSKS